MKRWVAILVALMSMMLSTSRPAYAQAKTKLSFAGGRAQASIPTDWNVFEIPDGRVMRMLVTPDSPVSNMRKLNHGVWLSAHSHHNFETIVNDPIPLLRSAIPTAELAGQIRQAVVRGYRSIDVPFRARSNRAGTMRVVAMQWGVIELGSIFQPPKDAGKVMSLMSSVQFNDRALTVPRVSGPLGALQPVVGTWKSFRSLVEITSDGRMNVRSDELRIIHSSGNYKAAEKGPRIALSGAIAPQDDLLFVTWSDNSQLNIRWKRVGPYLLFTDHRGKTSRLHQVVK